MELFRYQKTLRNQPFLKSRKRYGIRPFKESEKNGMGLSKNSKHFGIRFFKEPENILGWSSSENEKHFGIRPFKLSKTLWDMTLKRTRNS